MSRELFRFTDGRFTICREHADWGLLKKRGWLSGALHEIVAPDHGGP